MEETCRCLPTAAGVVAWLLRKCGVMKNPKRPSRMRLESGKIGWILLWLLGIPIPVLLILFLLRGCT